MNGTGKTWEPEPRLAVPAERLTPAEVLEALTAAAGGAFLDGRTGEWTEGSGAPFRQVWIRVAREGLRSVARRLIEIHYPHFVVIAATDLGETIELPYVFRLYAGAPRQEILVVVTAVLPKADPVVDTLSDLIPGTLLSEREKQEMMGVRVADIPDGRRMFLPDDFPEGVFPWRKDETGPGPGMVRDLWATGRTDFDAKTAARAAAEQAAAAAAAPEAPAPAPAPAPGAGAEGAAP